MLRTKDLQISKLYYLFIYMQLTPSHILFCIFPKHTHPYQCIFLSKFLRGQDGYVQASVFYTFVVHICACCVRGTALLRDAYTTKSSTSCMVHAQVIFAGFLYPLIGQFALKESRNKLQKENLL